MQSAPAPSPGVLRINCISARRLITAAFGSFDGTALRATRLEVLGGPAWLDSDLYDISAKAEGAANLAQMGGPMMRALLEERFALKLRKEQRDKAVYAMSVAKEHLKIEPAKEGSCTPIDLDRLAERNASGIHYCGTGNNKRDGASVVAEWWGVTMAELAGRVLPPFVDRPVVDGTGLSGRYDIHLEFTASQPTGPMTLNGVTVQATAAAESDGLTVFAALEKQLGLKLSSDKRPVDVLVVDAIERPGEN